MKRKMRLFMLLTLLFTFTALFLPTMKETASALPRDTIGISLEEIGNKTVIQENQGDRFDKEDFVITNDVSTNLSISITDSDLVAGEYATVRMTITGNSFDVDYAYANLIVFYEGKPFTTSVFMGPVSDTVLEGEIYIYNSTVSGSYDIYSIELFNEEFGIYHEVLSDAYYVETDGELADLPVNFMTVSGTIGGFQPLSSITFGKENYSFGEFVEVKLVVDESAVDFVDASIVVGQYANDFSKPLWVDLEETSPGVFEGLMEVTTYLTPGKYNVESAFLYNDNYSLDIYDETYNTYYDMGNNFVEDYGDFFNIMGTTIDNNEPQIQSISINRTSIGKNESVIITVKATDDLSGIAGGYVQLEGSYEDLYIEEMSLIDQNTLIFEYKPYPFRLTDDEYWITSVEVYDKAMNHAFSYEGVDYSALSFTVGGYRNVGEISGSNRYNTAIEISKHFGMTDTVIIALGTDFPDALSAGPLSYELNAPILLALNNRVSTSTLNEIRRLGATNAILLGGPAAISEDVTTQLQSAGIVNVERIYGTNRYWTAVAVGEYLLQMQARYNYKSEYAVLASGNSFPDALAASSMASLDGRPILLTSATRLHSETRRFLVEEDIKYLSVIGGPSVISEEIVTEIEAMGILVNRHAGANRYETSVTIAKNFFPHSTIAFVANGLNFADALAAAPLAAMQNAPILLTRDTTLPSIVGGYLKNSLENSMEHVTVVGGNAAVGDSVKKAMSVALLDR